MDNHTNVECQPLSTREAVCFLFCRQLLEEGLLIKSNNNLRVLNNVQISPPSPEPIRNDAEKTTAVASADEQRPRKKWDAADYAPIEVYIDSTSPLPPIASSQPSTLASSSLGAPPATVTADDEDLSQISPTLRDLSEAEVMSRIRELRAQGRWSSTRLPLCVDAPRPKTNWDFLLEEMCVMHADFYLERVRKQRMAKLLAHEAALFVRTTKLRMVAVANNVATPVGERTTPRKRKQTLTVDSDDNNRQRKRRRRGSNNLKEELGGFEAEVEETEDAVLTALNANTKPATPNGFDLKTESLLVSNAPLGLSESENGMEENGNQLALSHDSGVAFDFSPLHFDPDDLDTDLMQTLLSAWDCDESIFSATVCDSLCNPLYTGPMLEPERVPTYAELQFPLFAYDDQENLYDGMDPRDVIGDISDDEEDGEGGELSPKTSTDESPLDSGVPSPSAVDELQPLATRNQNDRRHRASPTKRRQRRSEELKRLTGNQLFLTSEPNPVVLPDGKPGHTPAATVREWTDCDVPPFTPVEEYELLSTVMKQLAVIPLPMYIARNFCVNWEMVAMRVEQRSFHGRSPHRCCVHFRQLLGAAKKMPMNEGMEPLQLTADEVDEFDVAYTADPKAFEAKVSQSSAAQARCFVRAVTMKRKKHAELPRQADVWATRMRAIDEADQLRPYGVLRRQIQRPAKQQWRDGEDEPMDATEKLSLWCRLLELHGLEEPPLDDNSQMGPMSVLTRRKRPLPFEISMVYYQYSRRLRLSRILAASKTFLESVLKPPEPIPLIDRFTAHQRSEPAAFVRSAPPPRAPSAASTSQTPSPPPAAPQMVVRSFPRMLDVNFHFRGTPRYETAVERRLFARDIQRPPGVSSLDVQRSFDRMKDLMKAPTYVMDIRNPLSNSHATMRRMIRAASSHIIPRKPPRIDLSAEAQFTIDGQYAQRKLRPQVDERLHQQIRDTIDTADEDPFRVTRKGRDALLPLRTDKPMSMCGIGANAITTEANPMAGTSTRFSRLALSSPRAQKSVPVAEPNGMEEEAEHPAAPFALALFVRFDETDRLFQERFTSDVRFALTPAPLRTESDDAEPAETKSPVQDGVLYVRPLFVGEAVIKEEPMNLF